MHAQKTNVVAGVTWDLANERAQNISALTYQLFFDIPEEMNKPIPAKVEIALHLKDNSTPFQLDFNFYKENIQKIMVNQKVIPIDFIEGHIVINPIYLNSGNNKMQIELLLFYF
jgi:aminopeptidase N